MNAAELAAKVAALEGELVAKSSRIATLEARVSLLEAENARLRKAMAKGDPVDLTSKKVPTFRRLEEIVGGNKPDSIKTVAFDVIEVSDDEEEGVVVALEKGRSAEEGVLAAVPTPRKCAERAVNGESEGEEEADGGGGGGGDRCSANCGSNVGLEDDDVSITSNVGLEDDDVSITLPCGRKRAAARVITSDSEDEDGSHGARGSGGKVDDDDDDDDEPRRKRALRGLSDSENEGGGEGVRVFSLDGASPVSATGKENEDGDEDDMIPIRELVKKVRKEKVGEEDGELGETKGCSTPATTCSAQLVKRQSKRLCGARRVLNFVEPKDCQDNEYDSEEDDDMDEFIDDANSSENSANSAEPEDSDGSAPSAESSPDSEESDGEINYKDVMARIGRKKNAKEWKYEADMLSAFAERPELCLKAVCALYRKQTEDEQDEKATRWQNKQGFSQIDATRGSYIAEFLLDGDAFGPLKKTVHDLENYDHYALEFCRKVAAKYSKQLFAIYQNKEDPYFLP